MQLFDGLSKWQKRLIIFLIDLSMTQVAWFGAVWVSHDFLRPGELLDASVMVLVVQCLANYLCGLYRGVWRFASIPDLVRIVRAVCLGTGLLAIVFHANGFGFTGRTWLAGGLFLVVLLSLPRLLYRWLHEYSHGFSSGKRVLVVGAGSAGEGIIRDLRRSPLNETFWPVALVDDDAARHGREMHGVRIVGECSQIPEIARRYEAELILIAIPSASASRMREIVSYCEQSRVEFRTLPGIRDIADGKVNFSSIRKVLLEDLLGREQVRLDWHRIVDSITEKVILVTGGGGSIGAELCRQIGKLSPGRLVIIDSNEYNLYSIDMELREKFPGLVFDIHLGNVTDRVAMEKIFARSGPDLVFHVAAYKHVPLLESHIRMAMHNNIIGTQNIAELSHCYRVETFVLISTDKAVNPTNIMGATKRAAEIVCQGLNAISPVKFLTVRFGNVLDSAGSVIPLFRRQIEEGGPLTVTHEQITRYFMTIPEASQLILQAAAMEDAGGIFVLDMGEPVRIRYLAEQMIRLSGKEDIGIRYIGLRPGEKLHEELFHEGETVTDTAHPKIFRAKVRQSNAEWLTDILKKILLACESNSESELFQLLCEMVPEFRGGRRDPDVSCEKEQSPLMLPATT